MNDHKPDCFRPYKVPSTIQHKLERIQKRCAIHANLERVRKELDVIECDPERWASDYHQLLARRESLLEAELMAIDSNWEGALA